MGPPQYCSDIPDGYILPQEMPNNVLQQAHFKGGRHMKRISIYKILLIITLIANVESSFAQSKQTQNKSKAETSSLQGLTEAILVNGEPTLRILSPKNGAAEISYQIRDGEDALIFSVQHYEAFLYLQVPVASGKLYVTKTRLLFDPIGDKSQYFNINRSEVIKASAQKSGRFGRNIGHHILIEFKDQKKRFGIQFNGKDLIGYQGDFAKPATEYFERAFADFDLAFSEFQQYTASVRPELDEPDTFDIDDDSDPIIDKYDRFKDVTIIRTTRLPLKNKNRAIRVQAEYSFSGTTAIMPEKILFYLHASAPRVIFREDNIELNFIVDDQRIPAGKMLLANEEKVKTTVRQSIVISLPFQTFMRIAKGNTVEFQIGELEYGLPESHLRIFNELAEYATQNRTNKDNMK